MTIEEIKARKTEYGYSNEQLSALSGIPLSTIQKVLSGTTRSPRRSTILALESVFGAKKHLTDEKNIYRDKPETPRYPNQGSYTLEDYLALPDEQRVELIDGVFYDMSSPTMPHQLIGGEVFFKVKNFITSKGGSCVPFSAPADVQLDCDDKTIVQPDVFVVCDRSKITRARIFGAPDLVMEVLSPSTAMKDHLIKLYKYAGAGVREYWIIDPMNESVVKYLFSTPDAENPGGQILTETYTFEDEIPVTLFHNECMIDFREIKKQYSFIE